MSEKSKLKEFGDWMNEKAITRAQAISSLIAVFVFVVFNTASFHAWDDLAKAAIYIGLVICTMLLGYKVIDRKALTSAVFGIISDRSLNSWTKIKKLFNLILPILDEIGEEFDVLNIEQFRNPEPNPLRENVEKMAGGTTEFYISGTGTDWTKIDPELPTDTTTNNIKKE